jgi:hypothetical protein
MIRFIIRASGIRRFPSVSVSDSAIGAGLAIAADSTTGVDAQASCLAILILLFAMHKSTLLVSALALSALLSGCVGTGPNTQQGSVAGGTLGALAGAIIGHNSAGGDALGGALLGATAGAIAGGTLGNSVDNQRGTLYGYPAERSYRATQAEAPPPPPAAPTETIPASPAANAVWVPGYWLYDGRSYAWTGGHWEIPPPYARSYVAAHWENQGGRSVYVRSYWR